MSREPEDKTGGVSSLSSCVSGFDSRPVRVILNPSEAWPFDRVEPKEEPVEEAPF